MRTFLVGAALLAALPARAQLKPAAAPTLGATCDDLDLAPLASALTAEMAALAKKSSTTLKIGDRSVPAVEYAQKTLAPLAALAAAGNKGALCGALASRYAWYRVSDSSILMTAYHTPSVRGSLTADATFKYPLYKRPPDFVKCPNGTMGKMSGGACVPYDDTAAILGGSLKGKGLELVYLSDPYDALALHVEGASGIQLPDGKIISIGADGHNGLAYQNVSKLLAADGKMPPGPPPLSTLPGNPKARKYFTEHPAELNVYWGKNPHFVWFKMSPKGASGKLGALTPNRSIAIDPAFVPFGALMWIRAQKPVVTDGRITGMQPYTRVVLGQDTGAGIKGPNRIDVYYGEDAYAQAASAGTSVQGDAYVLVAK
jgi:membrane-bound lytic murein transglycosylase A